jgi:pilus assembly protein Flp/PilA
VRNGTNGTSSVRNRRRVMKSVVLRFMRDTSGATAIEYGLIAAGISVVIIGVVNALGGQLSNTFTTVSTQLGNAGK